MTSTPDTAPSAATLLTQAMLYRFEERAPVYDRENRFFTEDFEELRSSGYLNAAVPREFGGLGLSLAEIAPMQRRLAYYAPATAVAVNMHLYWTGTAADLRRNGDDSLAFVLEAAADGHVFAAGHGERGNDVPLLLSTAEAERVEGGWRITGHKIFGSLTPVWTRMGLHAMDTSDPSSPKIVHAFVNRDAPGIRVVETWDTIGMRATSSHDTILDDVFVPDSQVGLVCPAGFAGAGLFHLGVFAWGMLGFGAVYLGIADRALQLAVGAARSRTSIGIDRGAMAYNPEIQHAVANMYVDLLTAGTLLESTADHWSAGVDHADWPARILSAKQVAVEAGQRIVERAQEIAGGAAIATGHELERLYRDVRCGWFNGVNSFLTTELVGKGVLGVEPHPRW